MNTPFFDCAAERQVKFMAHGAAAPVPIPAEPELPLIVPMPQPEPAEDAPTGPDVPQTAASKLEVSLVDGESAKEFIDFYDALDDHYLSYNEEERWFLLKLAKCRWSVRRRRRMADKFESSLYAAQPDPTKWSEADFKRLALFDRYLTQAEQSAARAQSCVDSFMARREDLTRWQSEFELALRTFDLHKKMMEMKQEAPAKEAEAA
jgi:hypothetical protein